MVFWHLQWTFVASSTSNGTFKIVNAATQSLRNTRAVSFDLNDSSNTHALAVGDRDDPKTWWVNIGDPKEQNVVTFVICRFLILCSSVHQPVV